MKRVGALLATAALFVCSLIGLDASEGTAPYAASPAPVVSPPVSYDVGEMPGAVPVSMAIQNRGSTDDQLLGGSTPAAARVEIHASRLSHGVRQMLPLVEGITIHGGETLMLEPASNHLMLVGLREDLIQGASFPLTLRFAQAREVTITVRVRRKVDAAGLIPIAPAIAKDLTISLASAPPAAAPAATPPAP